MTALFTIAEGGNDPSVHTEMSGKPKHSAYNDKVSFSLKRGSDSDTCYNMDEPWGHYMKWNKLVTKTNILGFYLMSNSQTENRMVAAKG